MDDDLIFDLENESLQELAIVWIHKRVVKTFEKEELDLGDNKCIYPAGIGTDLYFL